MGVFKNLILFIKSRGVSDRFPKENSLTEMLNIMSFVTAASSGVMTLLSILIFKDVPFLMIGVMVTMMYSCLILLHHFHKIREARLYFALVNPFWYIITMFLIGGNFGQDIAFLATISITFLHYYRNVELRNKLVFFNILLFLIPTIYLGFYDPFFGRRDFPLDETVAFINGIGWMFIIFGIHENRASSYIKALARKNIELEAKSSELERFTYIASHDLKSPLNNISNFLLLMENDLKQKKYNNLNTYMEYARTGAEQMDDLIDGVNTLSSSNNKDDSNDWEEVNLNETLKKVTNNLRTDIEAKNAGIKKENVLPVFRCNESDFVIIFQNLIQNGLKYNQSEAPEIVIINKSSQDTIRIEFTDNGIGISEKYYNDIFEYFKRLHNQKIYKGSGLGLGLCKKIVNKYGGEISVHSKLNEFSTFIISIPVIQEKNQEIKIEELTNNL